MLKLSISGLVFYRHSQAGYIDINDFLGKGTGAGATNLVNVFGHTATACIAFCQTLKNLWSAGVVMLCKEILRLCLCLTAVRRTGSHFA